MNDKNRRLNVLHIFSGDLWAGAEVMIFNLLNTLKEAPDLRILAFSLNEGVLTRRLTAAGVETHVIPEYDNSFPSIFSLVLNLSKKERIDVIHSHRYKENLLAFLLAKFLGVKKLITTVHGLPEISPDQRRRLPLKTRVDHFILRNYFTDVVAVSRELKDVLIQRYHFDSSSVNTVHNGIPVSITGRSLEQEKKGSFHIGTVGRMVPVKDFTLFLEAAFEIRSRMGNVRFSILGEGPLRSELEKKARHLALQDCVEFLSPVADPTSYYRSIDLYLNTSFHEGIPMSILEAMAMGKPAVATSVGGIPEIISDGESGLLVKGREPEKIAHACMRIMLDDDLRNRMSVNALKRVASSFSSSKMAESYKRLYEDQA